MHSVQLGFGSFVDSALLGQRHRHLVQKIDGAVVRFRRTQIVETLCFAKPCCVVTNNQSVKAGVGTGKFPTVAGQVVL